MRAVQEEAVEEIGRSLGLVVNLTTMHDAAPVPPPASAASTATGEQRAIKRSRGESEAGELEAGEAEGEPAGRRRRPAPVEDAATIARNRRLFGVLLVGQLSKAASSNEAEAGRRARAAAALAEQEAAAKAQRGPRPREWSAERGRERDGAASASAVRSKSAAAEAEDFERTARFACAHLSSLAALVGSPYLVTSTHPPLFWAPRRDTRSTKEEGRRSGESARRHAAALVACSARTSAKLADAVTAAQERGGEGSSPGGHSPRRAEVSSHPTKNVDGLHLDYDE